MMIKEGLIPDRSVIPVPENKRISTDVICTIIGALFALTLFILACIFYNGDALDATYFNFNGTPTSPATASSGDYYGFKNTFWAVVLTSLGLGLIWLAIVHLAPRIAPHIAHVLAILTLLALGLLILLAPSNYFNNHGVWKIIIAVVCFLLAIIIFTMFWFYSNELRLQGIFLDYACRFLHSQPGTFGYIPLFLLFTAGLIALITFQHLAFSAKAGVKNTNYWDFSNPGFLGVLNIIEFIWGFQFLRDAFNFCVSGAACDWYWNNSQAKCYTPIQRLLTRHWGSVVGGSFVNGFFELPTLLVELFTCHAGTCCHGVGSKCDQKCPMGVCFDLVRTDSYSYITLTSLPFCNAGRECHNLCMNGDQFVAGYNPMKHYRFVASVFLVALGFLLGHIYANKHVAGLTWWHLVVIILTVYCCVWTFVDCTADAAEGISTSFFAEHSLARDYQSMTLAQQPFRQEIQQRANRDLKTRDGHC